MGDPFVVLSVDLFRVILSKCDNAALVRAGCVSRKWRSVSRGGTVLGIYKTQRVLYFNGRSRWDWDCSLFQIQEADVGEAACREAPPRSACGSRHPLANTSGASTSMSLVEGVFQDATYFKGDFRHIDLSHMRWEGPLALDPYKDVEFAAIPPSCSTLSTKGCHQLKQIQVGATGLQSQQVNQGLQSVTQIDLVGCRNLSNDSLKRLFPGTGTLENLSVILAHSCTLLEDETLAAIVRRCPNLKKLGLTGIAGPATLRALATATDSRLESIELLHSPKIRDADVLPLLTACPHLRRCNLRGCKGISGPAYNAIAKELSSRLAAEGVPVPSAFYYLKR